MRAIHVDPEQMTVRVQPGAKIEELDHATTFYGLCTPMGTVGDTGVFGLSLGGGMGRLQRMYGFAVDNIVEAEVVLADESIVTCNEERNSDLLWAIRGAGSNFGIVTSLVFRLYPAPQAYRGIIGYPLAAPDTKQTLINVINHFRNIGSNNNSFNMLFVHPPDGNRVAMIEILFYTSPEEGESLSKEIPIGQPFLNNWHPVGYLDAQRGILPPSTFQRSYFYLKGGLIADLTEEILTRLFEYHENSIPGCILNHTLMGGAVFDRSLDKASYPCKSGYSVEVLVTWPEGDGEASIRWLKDAHEGLKEFMIGVYYNFSSEWAPNEKRLNETFGPSLPRLLELKGKYDPNNVFRRNFNLSTQ